MEYRSFLFHRKGYNLPYEIKTLRGDATVCAKEIRRFDGRTQCGIFVGKDPFDYKEEKYNDHYFKE